MVLVKKFIKFFLFTMIEVMFVTSMKIRLNVKFLYGVCYREIFCVVRHNKVCFLHINRMDSLFHFIRNTIQALRVVLKTNKPFF